MNKKLLITLIIILIVPIFIFFFRPKVDTKEKYIKLSWAHSSTAIQRAIKEKKPGILLNDIFKDQKASENQIKSNGKNLNQSIKNKINHYIEYTREKIKRFINKLKEFIS